MLEYTALTMLIISLDHDIELFLYIEKKKCAELPPPPHFWLPLNQRLCKSATGQLSQGTGLGTDLTCLSSIWMLVVYDVFYMSIFKGMFWKHMP